MRVIDPSLSLTQIRVSPLSWGATFVGDEFATLYLSDVLGGLRHRDGTLTELKHTSGGTETNGDKTVYTVRAGDSFEPALGLSDVTAVVIEGVEFPLK